MIRALSNMDYIIAPISADRVVLESTLRYMTVVNDVIRKTGVSNIKGTYLVWNMVDGREKSELYEVYEQVIAELGLHVLKTFIPDSKRFRRELSAGHRPLFRSTLFPADRSLLRGSNIEALTDEVLTCSTSATMAKRMKAGPLDESLIIQSFKDADLLADPANAVLQEPESVRRHPAGTERSRRHRARTEQNRRHSAGTERSLWRTRPPYRPTAPRRASPAAAREATTRYISNAGNSRRGSPFTSVRRYTAPSSSWYTCWRSRARRSA